jgi:hypothetical protein
MKTCIVCVVKSKLDKKVIFFLTENARDFLEEMKSAGSDVSE